MIFCVQDSMVIVKSIIDGLELYNDRKHLELFKDPWSIWELFTGRKVSRMIFLFVDDLPNLRVVRIPWYLYESPIEGLEFYKDHKHLELFNSGGDKIRARLEVS